MVDERLVTVMTFGTPQEAAIAQGFLKNHGIESYVQGGEMATALFHVGTALGGVQLQVAESQAERSRHFLHTEFSAGGPVEAWICSKCGEDVDAGYEICWSCAEPHTSASSPPEQTTDVDQEQPKGGEWDVPSETEAESVEPEPSITDGAAQLERAWKAAIFGILLPPLQIYALVILFSISDPDVRSTPKYWGTFVFALAYMAMGVLFCCGGLDALRPTEF